MTTHKYPNPELVSLINAAPSRPGRSSGGQSQAEMLGLAAMREEMICCCRIGGLVEVEKRRKEGREMTTDHEHE
jgi:hypothetical protein